MGPRSLLLQHRMVNMTDKEILQSLGDDLWDADAECEHDIENAPGGGVRCTKCNGWFCY